MYKSVTFEEEFVSSVPLDDLITILAVISALLDCKTSNVNLTSLPSVSSIIKSSLKLYKRGHSDITEIFICSDNAG